jgi:hypothetical protein
MPREAAVYTTSYLLHTGGSLLQRSGMLAPGQQAKFRECIVHSIQRYSPCRETFADLLGFNDSYEVLCAALLLLFATRMQLLLLPFLPLPLLLVLVQERRAHCVRLY